ncbi:uncharacterized protein (DUF2147 family) [Sphingomonas naasensis]|uniref:DUF2147 domain-containing protein n=1 Tax=Sphingomonas naasensis TaxID=1344951 RepID=A0A4S1WL38_9SPHN|nr:DUF2147 domain-containing protein [Sphingomonas naasensis]NIJ21797.1 uncharacterized protein (DUF2147 family) [Sphingomonas naasensis]TGX42500.1 DUF2147 domain-containing protein [Sphingomonas naasensis]
MLLTLVGLSIAAAAPQSTDSAIGRWRTETRGGIVEIQRCGASICGRLLTSDKIRTDPNLKDANNSNAALRGRPLRGLQILAGFTRSGDGWTGGKIYNAEDGKTYGADVTPAGPDTLKVRGCVFKPFCKTQTWTRVR